MVAVGWIFQRVGKESGLFDDVSKMDTAWHNDETLYAELLT